MSAIFDHAAMTERVNARLGSKSTFGSQIPRAMSFAEWMSKNFPDGIPSPDRLHAILTHQLDEPGRPWGQMTPLCKRVLYLCVAGERSAEIARILTENGLDAMRSIEPHLAREAESLATRLMTRHHFETTLMLAAFKECQARRSPYDSREVRLLTFDIKAWLLSLTAGRPTPFAEVAGIVAHHAVEEARGKPVSTPSFSTLPSAIMNWASSQAA